MFISLEKIWLEQRPRGIQGDLQNQRQYIPTNTDNKESYAKILSKPHSSTGSHDTSPQISDVDPTPPSSKPRPRYKVSDRVVVFNKDDIALYGTVKWTGKKSRFGRDFGVGIEMVRLYIW